MGHFSQYREAMEKIIDDPLALTTADYAVLEEFGGPQDVQRARRAVAKASTPVGDAVQTKVAPASYVTPARLRQALDDTCEGIAKATLEFMRPHVFARLVALEKRLAAVDGIAPPKAPGPPAETTVKAVEPKPRIRYVGAWQPKTLFAEGDGVTFDGRLYKCLAPSFGTPSLDTNSWVAVDQPAA